MQSRLRFIQSMDRILFICASCRIMPSYSPISMFCEKCIIIYTWHSHTLQNPTTAYHIMVHIMRSANFLCRVFHLRCRRAPVNRKDRVPSNKKRTRKNPSGFPSLFLPPRETVPPLLKNYWLWFVAKIIQYY